MSKKRMKALSPLFSSGRDLGLGDQNPQGYWSPRPTSPRKRAGYNGPGWGLWSARAVTGPTTVAPARRGARAASLRSTAPVFISKLHLIFITRRQFIDC